MKILITGVAGFIGSNLAARLIVEGHTVTGIDNLSFGFERNIAGISSNKCFRFIRGDVLDASCMDGIEAEVIVHLASHKIPRYTNALKTLEDNMSTLKNVVQKCVRDKARIIFTSTSDVYGKNEKVPFKEDSDLVLGQTTVKRWAYALSKIYGEQYIIANHDEYGMDYTITRLFGSYGPHQHLSWWGGPQSVFISKAIKKEALEIHGDGKQIRTFTYIEDTVQALFRCITDHKAVGQIFNVGSEADCEISIIGLARMIWAMINGKDAEAKIDLVPYSTFGNYEDVMRRLPDIRKIKSCLDYRPRYGLEEGLRRTIEWQRKVI